MRQHDRRGALRMLLGMSLLCTALAATNLPLVAAAPAAKTISLVVDYGDGAELHFTALAWRDGMTVIDALAAAAKHPHGVKFVQRGKGATALVTKIGDLANQGAGKNWIYSVGGQTAEVGAGSYELSPGDRVLWEFKEYE